MIQQNDAFRKETQRRPRHHAQRTKRHDIILYVTWGPCISWRIIRAYIYGGVKNMPSTGCLTPPPPWYTCDTHVCIYVCIYRLRQVLFKLVYFVWSNIFTNIVLYLSPYIIYVYNPITATTGVVILPTRSESRNRWTSLPNDTTGLSWAYYCSIRVFFKHLQQYIYVTNTRNDGNQGACLCECMHNACMHVFEEVTPSTKNNQKQDTRTDPHPPTPTHPHMHAHTDAFSSTRYIHMMIHIIQHNSSKYIYIYIHKKEFLYFGLMRKDEDKWLMCLYVQQ